jgi:NAD(P)H-hydrate repair Nnr-like enzyme with NAD(P)H-hydrate dehydratase domain
MAPFHAACAAVHAHAGAGRGAAAALGPASVIASDVLDALPAVLRAAGRAPPDRDRRREQ